MNEKELEIRIRFASFLQRVLMGDKSDKRVAFFDVDGTLCEGEAWDLMAMQNAIPIPEAINVVNGVYGKRNYQVVIRTARGNLAKSRLHYDMIYWTTHRWLMKHGVRFNKLDIKKKACTFTWCDKTFNSAHLQGG